MAPRPLGSRLRVRTPVAGRQGGGRAGPARGRRGQAGALGGWGPRVRLGPGRERRPLGERTPGAARGAPRLSRVPAPRQVGGARGRPRPCPRAPRRRRQWPSRWGGRWCGSSAAPATPLQKAPRPTSAPPTTGEHDPPRPDPPHALRPGPLSPPRAQRCSRPGRALRPPGLAPAPSGLERASPGLQPFPVLGPRFGALRVRLSNPRLGLLFRPCVGGLLGRTERWPCGEESDTHSPGFHLPHPKTLGPPARLGVIAESRARVRLEHREWDPRTRKTPGPVWLPT